MARNRLFLILALALFIAQPGTVSAQQSTLTVGSKRFTESYILGAIITRAAAAAGEAKVQYKQGLGNTGIVFAALKTGNIDVYPEYTGTIDQELLKNKTPSDLASLSRQLAPMGLAVGVPLGFNDTYALAMPEAKAKQLGIRTISDLAKHPDLKLGLDQEFLKRADGWPGLKKAYHLPFTNPEGLDHGLVYQAIGSGAIDVTDIYSTDAKIARYHLLVLEDNRQYFPAYDAVLLYRLDVPKRVPRTWAAIEKLKNRITATEMIKMNAAAELQGESFTAIAAQFLGRQKISAAGAGESTGFLHLLFGSDFWTLTKQHLFLVFASLLLGIIVGIPLGIAAERSPSLAQPILGFVGVLQTIPSLALLIFFLAALHRIGSIPAILALFLYSLLPIVRNTYSGLLDIPPSLRESAAALGLSSGARLRLIELPLAARSILAGVKTSAVINVGTATIAAFIGAGGYGERIVEGLALNRTDVLLAGALPAAALALIIQGAFDILDRWLIPAGLRIKGDR